MKRPLLFRSVTLACVMAFSALLWAQSNPPTTSGQGQGQGQQQQAEDPIQKLRDNAKKGDAKNRLEASFDAIGQIEAKVKELVAFRAITRNSKGEVIPLLYSLKGAPIDAVIDPETGNFGWIPTAPGTFQFSIIGTDPGDLNRSVSTQITVVVSRQLEYFGYSFFVAPRAAILARMQAIQQGLVHPGLPIRPNGASPMTDGLVPEGSALSAVLKKPDPQFPPSNNGPGNSQAGNQGQGQTGQGQGQGGQAGTGGEAGAAAGGAQTPPNGQATSQGQANQGQGTGGPATGFGAPAINPYGVRFNQQDPANLQQLDASRYFVGPFDMMGANVFVPAPDRYQLGPGDVLTIRVWSDTMDPQEFTAKVSARGTVDLPVSGKQIVVRGQTLAQAEAAMKREIVRYVRNGDLTLNLKELRTMAITVLGEAFMPGSYQVPAVMTLFNAIYMFGGPTDQGSLRAIELRRTDGSRKTFDLYKFLVYGDAKQDVPLQPGDTIFIPPVEARVTVNGEVNRPGIFEVVPGEKLRDMLEFAGKAKPTGVSQRISHTTVDPGKALKLADIDLTQGGPANNPPVFGGDKIEVFSVRPILTNVITLEGAVDQPGQYAWHEGATIKSVVERARGLIQEAYRPRADLFRMNDDKTTTLIVVDLERALAGDPQANLPLKPFDKLKVYATPDVTWMGERRVTVRGAVRKPGEYERSDNMRLLDLLIQAGGLNGNAFMEQGFLQRFNADGTAGEIIRIDFRKAAVGDPAMNVELRDRDVLTIQSVSEAQFIPEQQVRILGAVQSPGQYLRSSNMTLQDLIQLAGGLLPEAGEVLEVARSRVPDGTPSRQFNVKDVLAGTVSLTLEPGDLVTIPIKSNFQSAPRTVFVLGAVARQGVYSINATTDRISDIIKRAGGPTSTAFLRGAQFVRDPSKLKTLSQERLTPRVLEVLRLINEDEYKRALARAEVDKAKISRSLVGGQANDPAVAAAAIVGGAVPRTGTSGSTDVKPIPFKMETVTEARAMVDRDLIPAGNINVKFEQALANPGSTNDLVLEAGDVIVIPETPSTVAVTGAVMVPSAVLFVPGKTVAYYVERSGGFTVDVAKDRVLVIRAGGEVVKATARTRIELGDIILAPTKVMAERIADRQAEIDAISKNITSAGVVFAILKSLIGF